MEFRETHAGVLEAKGWVTWTPRERANLERILAERDRQVLSGERQHVLAVSNAHRAAWLSPETRERMRQKQEARRQREKGKA